MGFAWNLILFSFMREREGYKHHADCTVHILSGMSRDEYENIHCSRQRVSILQKEAVYSLSEKCLTMFRGDDQ